MKILAFALVLIASVPSFAELNVRVTPQFPLIIASDLNIPNKEPVHGPWFLSAYVVGNPDSEEVTIVSLQAVITSAEGQKIQHNMLLPSPVVLATNAFTTIRDIYLGSLPASNSRIYQVEVTLQGWTGSSDHRLEQTVSFSTL